MNTTVYLIRHGEVYNPQQIAYGRTAIPLSDAGIQQLKTLASKFKSLNITPDIIISSPLKRTVQSTEEIHNVFPNVPVKYIDDLQEVDCGTMTGMPQAFERRVGNIYDSEETKDMGIERPLAVTDRMLGVMKNALADYGGKTIFVVSHGDPLAFLVWRLMNPSGNHIPVLEIRDNNYPSKGKAWKLILNDRCELVSFLGSL